MSIQGWAAPCGRSCIIANQIFWSSHSTATDGHCWEQTDEATVVLKCLWHLVLMEHSFQMKMKRNLVACFFLILLYGLCSPHLDYCISKKGAQGVGCKETLRGFLEEIRCTFRLLRITVHQLSLGKGSMDVTPDARQREFPWVPLKGFSGQPLTHEE